MEREDALKPSELSLMPEVYWDLGGGEPHLDSNIERHLFILSDPVREAMQEYICSSVGNYWTFLVTSGGQDVFLVGKKASQQHQCVDQYNQNDANKVRNMLSERRRPQNKPKKCLREKLVQVSQQHRPGQLSQQNTTQDKTKQDNTCWFHHQEKQTTKPPLEQKGSTHL